MRKHFECVLAVPEYVGYGFIVRDKMHRTTYFDLEDVDGVLYAREISAEAHGLM